MAKKEGKKQRKYGRNKLWCTAYFNRGQRAKNKRKKLNKHIAKHPNDAIALVALKNIK
jgi:hypothetical protein